MSDALARTLIRLTDLEIDNHRLRVENSRLSKQCKRREMLKGIILLSIVTGAICLAFGPWAALGSLGAGMAIACFALIS